MSLYEEEEVKVDPSFARLIREMGGENLYVCLQCGTCSGSCPSGRVTAYRTRMVIRSSLAGLKDKVLGEKDIWLCTTCRTCATRCPRGIDVTKAITTIRNIAVAEGHALHPHYILSNNVIRTGCAFGDQLGEDFVDLRRSLGLPEKPVSITFAGDGEALEKFRGVTKATGFDKLMDVKRKKEEEEKE
ncbi:MAG: CoB--CoM heterodisulfide reductase subunit C [Promethearchaeota archaeon]